MVVDLRMAQIFDDFAEIGESRNMKREPITSLLQTATDTINHYKTQ